MDYTASFARKIAQFQLICFQGSVQEIGDGQEDYSDSNLLCYKAFADSGRCDLDLLLALVASIYFHNSTSMQIICMMICCLGQIPIASNFWAGYISLFPHIDWVVLYFLINGLNFPYSSFQAFDDCYNTDDLLVTMAYFVHNSISLDGQYNDYSF